MYAPDSSRANSAPALRSSHSESDAMAAMNPAPIPCPSPSVCERAARTVRHTWQMSVRTVRIATRTAKLLLMCRRAFPVWLRITFVIGCIQIPFSPIDELALIVAGLTVALHPRYRRLAKLAWREARTDVDSGVQA